MPQPGSILTLPVPADFDLPRAVCSYGYFLLAPNRWHGPTVTLHRPLRLNEGVVVLRIRQPRGAGTPLRIACDSRLSRAEQTQAKRALTRMLRVDEDLTPWFALHAEARRQRFGRLFRSPSLFEDMVKTITGCNVTWRNTMSMNRLLCDRLGGGAFPAVERLARFTPGELKRRCRVGYRAERIIRLARDVEAGRLDLAWFEQAGRTSEAVYDALRRIHGIGDYAAGNLCQLLGFYDRLAIDTETYRHYCHVHGIDRPRDPATLHEPIQAYYAQYQPYAFLAYWFELWQDYQRRFGDARQWDAETDGPNFTAATLRRASSS